MIKRYVSLGNWVDKKTGECMSKLAEISEGISKAGNAYQVVDTDKTMNESGCIAVGTIVSIKMTVIDSSASPSEDDEMPF